MGTFDGRWPGAVWRFGPPVLWLAIISTLSTDAFSSEHTGSILLPILRWLFPHAANATLELAHAVIRKAGHLTEYGILAVLWYRAVRRRGRAWQPRAALIAFALAAGFAGLDEYHQSFVPSRGASIADVGLDSVGAALALALSSTVHRVRGIGVERH
jgi:VanZ family protein